MNNSSKIKTIPYQKNKIIDSSLLFGSTLGLIAFALSLIGYNDSEYKTGFLIDLTAIITFGILFIYRKQISLNKKVYGSLIAVFLLTINDLYKYGIYSENKILFIAIPLISYLIFSIREAIIFSTIAAVSYLAMGVLFKMEILTPVCDHNIRANEIHVWLINIVLISILSVIVIVIIKQYNKILLDLISNLHRKNYELIDYKDKLEEMVSKKTSDLKRTNEELQSTLKDLKDTQYQLIQADKMASISVLTAGVAHEINNPLNYILAGYTGLESYINSNNIKNNDVSEFLNHIKSGVDKASDIVKKLDYYNEYEDLPNEYCNIQNIIENSLSVLNFKYENKISVKKNFPQEPAIIEGNINNLHQVFTNIILNSIQAITDEGHIEITTQKIDDIIQVSISDTGSGINSDSISKVTDPFYTTKEPDKGTGLGLSIVYTLIKKHKGNIEFSSVENKGTTVKVTLPQKQ